MQPTRTYEIPARRDVLGSPLGRLIALRCADERAAASLWIVAVTILSVALVATCVAVATISGDGATVLWSMRDASGMLFLSVVTALLFVLCCPRNGGAASVVLGRRLRIVAPGRVLEFDARRVRVRMIGRELYHAHYGRYADTRKFVGSLRQRHLLLVEIDDELPIVIELKERDRSDLVRRLQRPGTTSVAAESVLRADAA